MYEAVNRCTTLTELADIIRSAAEVDGLIRGRTKPFNAEKMAQRCEDFEKQPTNVLTRNWGIRQQAMMIVYYKN